MPSSFIASFYVCVTPLSGGRRCPALFQQTHWLCVSSLAERPAKSKRVASEG